MKNITAKRFEDLEVWKMARQLCKKVWKVTQKESFSKDFALKNQINRSSGSAMDNIAEGFERNGNGEFVHFLFVSKGSAGEVRSQIVRSYDRQYINRVEFEELYGDAKKLGGALMNFIKSIKDSDYKGPKYKP